MSQLKYLNLGCGRVILPAPTPAHYGLIDPITEYALWHNVDRNPEPGVDETLDIFRYPWHWADNSFDGALLAHIAEHVPHEIGQADYPIEKEEYTSGRGEPARKWQTRSVELRGLQDGWYAFFAELHRVLTPGAIIHVLSPYAFSSGAMTDPTHTRYLTEHVWTHSMQPDPNSPFKYATGGLNLELVAPVRFGLTGLFNVTSQAELEFYLPRYLNVAYEQYVKLRVVK